MIKALAFTVSLILSLFLTFQVSKPYMVDVHQIPIVGDKFVHLLKAPVHYNTVFLGSSRIYRQVVPSVFNESLKEFDIHSFNFGIFAMRTPETIFWLQKLLEEYKTGKALSKIEWIFLELELNSVYEPIENAKTIRSRYWHNSSYTLSIIQYISGLDLNPVTKGVFTYSHILPCFYNLINLGELVPALPKLSIDSDPDSDVLGQNKDGYVPLDLETGPGYLQRHQDFLNNQEKYQSKVADLADFLQKDYFYRLPEAKIQLIKTVVEEIESLGIKVAFVLPPRVDPVLDQIQLQRSGYIPVLFNFNDPNKYPNLFAVDRHYDEFHLNHRGSVEFTRMLAQDFQDYLINSSS
jgi:hypothetical protein